METMLTMQSLGVLIAWHFVADYGLQTDYVAKNKANDRLVLFAHCWIHSLAGFYLVSFLFGLYILLLHYLIDGSELKNKPLDQALHLAIILFGYSVYQLKN